MKIKFLLFLFLISFYSLNAQKRFNERKIEHFRGPDVVCPGSFVEHQSFVDMPESVKRKLSGKNAKNVESQGATFIVNYVGFPANAKAAFQKAVDIWAALLTSTVPIRVTAYWEDLGEGVLGAANTNDYLRNFSGAKESNTFYPIALAEKLAGKGLNANSEDDIFCRFSKTMPWYYGNSPTVPVGQFDFTTIVLHELGHGLGFTSSMRVAGTQGSYGFGTKHKAIYDKYLINGEKKWLADTLSFKNPSNALRNALVSEDIYFESPRTKDSTTAGKVLIFAPNPYQSGSSISHLDDTKYGHGGVNSLMTPTASLREKNLNPGPITMKMFYDMGWKSSSIVHEPFKNFKAVEMVKVKAKILSDTTLVQNSAQLFYAFNGGGTSKAVNVNLIYDAKTGEYFADVAIPAGTTKMDYYLTVKDHFGETLTSPASGGFGSSNYVWGFDIGSNDVAGPVIEHYAPKILSSSSPVSLVANVEDDFEAGIDTVVVNYSVNGVAKGPFGLKKYNPLKDNPVFSQGTGDGLSYFGESVISGLKDGDVVKYQIVATDKSKNKTTLPTLYTGTNQKDVPVVSFYEFTVTSIKNTSVSEYETNFENSTDDFALLGFGIAQPADFSSKGLHSSHPYTNGLGLLDPISGSPYMNFQKDEIAMLRTPIRLKETDAVISYDEVVLVEPGDAGSTFGNSSFYDYVVVEGSLDGVLWFPLQDGYDSRIESSWNTLYNDNFSSGDAGNSTAKGTQTLMKKREIEIYNSDFGSEFAGENLLVRFRLYADQWTAGWGWALDNLYIQKKAPVILASEPKPVVGLSVFPNPTSDKLQVSLELATPQVVKVQVYSLRGSMVLEELVPVADTKLDYEINLSALSSGTYMLKITEKRGQVVRKFVVGNR
jgi:Secretion system C-terminal sorting domain